MKNFNLDELFKSPEYRVTAEVDGIKEIYYANEPYKGKPTEVFAYLGIPESCEGKVPGMVCIHGGGGKAFKEWVKLWNDRGYAAIAMDFGGKGPDGEFHTAPGPDQTHEEKFGVDLDWEDLWTYHAVSAIVRAHSILREQPEVDAARTGMTGISWGGYLTCCTSGVDDRFKLAVPVYGCGFLQDNSAVDWLEFFKTMTPERKQWWHDNCDPSVYLKNAKMPMLFVTGTNDFAYPLDSLLKTCKTPQGKVRTCIRLEMAHGHEAGWAPEEIGRFADSVIGDGPELPEIGSLCVCDKFVQAEFTSKLPVKGYFLWTCDEGSWQERKWHQADAAITESTVKAAIPDCTTSFFLVVEDSAGGYVSSLPEIIC